MLAHQLGGSDGSMHLLLLGLIRVVKSIDFSGKSDLEVKLGKAADPFYMSHVKEDGFLVIFSLFVMELESPLL